jgi:sugar lactone lactonase YvrE
MASLSLLLPPGRIAFLILASLLLDLALGAATAPAIDWVIKTGESHGDGLAVDAAGNIYTSRTVLGPVEQFIIEKRNNAGILAWSSSIDGTGQGNFEYSFSKIALDHQNNIIVGGAHFAPLSLPTMATQKSIFFAKISANGTLVWAKDYATTDLNTPFKFSPLVDSQNDIFSGFTYTLPIDPAIPASTFGDHIALKLESNGSIVWVQPAQSGQTEISGFAFLDQQDHCWLGGLYLSQLRMQSLTIDPVTKDNESGFLAKISSEGTIQNSVRFGGLLPGAHIDSLQAGPAGENILAAGLVRFAYPHQTTSSVLAGDKTIQINGRNYLEGGPDAAGYFFAKIDQEGKIIWIKAGSGYFRPVSIFDDPAGNSYLLGETLSSLSGPLATGFAGGSGHGGDWVLAKISAAGETLWLKHFGNLYQDNAGDARWTPDGIVMTGTFYSSTLFDEIPLDTSHAMESFILKLKPEPALPVISSAPESLTLAVGSSARFSVTASGNAPVAYQWFFRGEKIEGATTAELVIASLTPASVGDYFVEIANEAGVIRSATAHLFLSQQPQVAVTTVSGSTAPGFANSSLAGEVRFNQPNGLASLGNGIIAVADGANHAVRLVGADGSATVAAGDGTPGYVDDLAVNARFNFPLSVAKDPAGDILVADALNHAIRRIEMFGLRRVTTVAGNGLPGLKNGVGRDAQLNYPNDLVADSDGNIFVTEFMNHTVRKISPTGTVTTFAGTGISGWQDGPAATAQFTSPGGITIDSSRNLYITEYHGHRIRKITPAGFVSTIAGTNIAGFADGRGSSARFNTPDGIAVDPLGNLYVTEWENHSVRRIDAQGSVLTIAGLGTPGYIDGDQNSAQFNRPSAIIWLPGGKLWVSDYSNHCIRQIELLDEPQRASAILSLDLHPGLTIFGLAGKSYRIEATESETAPFAWITLDTVKLTREHLRWYDPQPAGRKKRIYRAMQVD